MRTRFLTLALIVPALSNAAHAQVTNVTLSRHHSYLQSSAAIPTVPDVFRTSISIETSTVGTIAAATATFPGGSPIPLIPSIAFGDYFFLHGTFASDASLLTAYPEGTYSFSHTGGTAPARTFSSTLAYAAFPTQILAANSSTFTSLSAVTPGQTISITLAEAPTSHVVATIIDPANLTLHGITIPALGATTFNLSTIYLGSPLLPNHLYELRLTTSANTPTTTIPVPGWPSRAEIGVSSNETRIPFTSIPTPASSSLLLLAPLALARRRAKR
jgi:hypothetical protein